MVKAIREKGYSQLLIIMQKKGQTTQNKINERLGANLFLCGDRDIESARRLGEMIK